MQHRLHVAAGFQRSHQFVGKRRGDGAIDHAHLRRDGVAGEFPDQIGGAVLASKIEQGCLCIGVALGDELHQIVHVAASRSDIGKARLLRRFRAAAADGIDGQFKQRGEGRIAGDRAGRIGAGDHDRPPGAAEIGFDRLDPHQRHLPHVMAARGQGGGGAFAGGLRAGDDDAHDFSLSLFRSFPRKRESNS